MISEHKQAFEMPNQHKFQIKSEYRQYVFMYEVN